MTKTIGLQLYDSVDVNPKLATQAMEAAEVLLSEQKLCSVATCAASGDPYIHTAYFAWHKKREDLIFLSGLSSQHAINIQNHSSVAVNIFRETRNWGEEISGIQIIGKARILDKEESEKLLPVYVSKFPQAKQALQEGFVEDFSESRIFYVNVEEIKLVDEHRFKDEIYVVLRHRK